MNASGHTAFAMSEDFHAMRWDDESYVRLFRRTTPDWSLVPGPARSLFYALLREVDRAGILPMRKGLAGVAKVIDWPQDLFDRYFPELLDDGCVRIEGDTLVIPNYLAAQEVHMSDAQRKRDQRERDQARVLGKRDNISVTRGHTESQSVTPSQAKKSIEEPNTKSFAGESSLPMRGQVALLPDVPKPARPARQTRASEPAPTSRTWESYAAAYERRYGKPPTRNAKVNGQLAQLVAQMGADVAPALASYYLTHPASIYAQAFHSIGLLLRDAQALKTQMETRTVTIDRGGFGPRVPTPEVPRNSVLSELTRKPKPDDGEGHVDF